MDIPVSSAQIAPGPAAYVHSQSTGASAAVTSGTHCGSHDVKTIEVAETLLSLGSQAPFNERVSGQQPVDIASRSVESIATTSVEPLQKSRRSKKRKASNRDAQKAYRQSDKGKAAQEAARKVYQQSDKGKAAHRGAQRAYQRSDKGKATQKAYLLQSVEGKAYQKAYQKTYQAVLRRTHDKEQARIASRTAANRATAVIRQKSQARNTFALSLNPSDTSTIKFLDGQLTSINICVNGIQFKGIDGNNKDEQLSKTTKKHHKFSIEIVDCDGNKSSHTPDKRFQENFMRVINQGMLSFYKKSIDPNAIHFLSERINREVFGDQLNIPTCMEFARYLICDIDSLDQLRLKNKSLNFVYIDGIQDAPDFSLVAIISPKSTHSMHEFIHIANGICLKKVGVTHIYFAKFDHLLEYYKLRSNEYRLVVLKR